MGGGELEEAEWSGNGSLLYIVEMDRDFVVSLHHVDFAQGAPKSWWE
jgi:hypothetical protein